LLHDVFEEVMLMYQFVRDEFVMEKLANPEEFPHSRSDVFKPSFEVILT
jgi:hypothetical protein